MKTFLKLFIGFIMVGTIILNLNYYSIGQVSHNNLGFSFFENMVNANPENPCSGGGILGYDEESLLCKCGVWTTGCLSMYNYCCGVSDNCAELCEDVVEITSNGR